MEGEDKAWTVAEIVDRFGLCRELSRTREREVKMNALLFLVAAGATTNDSGTTTIAVALVAAFASLVVAIMALFGTAATAFTSARNARTAAEALRTSSETAATAALTNARTAVYSSTVTAERSKWINALRGNIALFSRKLRALS